MPLRRAGHDRQTQDKEGQRQQAQPPPLGQCAFGVAPVKGRQVAGQISHQALADVSFDADFEADVGQEPTSSIPQPGCVEGQDDCLGCQPAPKMAGRAPGAEMADQDHGVQAQEQENGIVVAVERRRHGQGITGRPAAALRLPAEGTVPGQQSHECHQAVHAHFLGVIDVKGRDSQQQCRHQPRPPAQQPLAGHVQERHRCRADQDRQQANGQDAAAQGADPGVEQEVVEGGVDVHRRQPQYGARIAASEIEAPALIPPEGLGEDAGQAQAKGQEQQRPKEQVLPALDEPPVAGPGLLLARSVHGTSIPHLGGLQRIWKGTDFGVADGWALQRIWEGANLGVADGWALQRIWKGTNSCAGGARIRFFLHSL